ncbi:unnamed protein product [Mesocestoides corti]|uniref:Uncharacterized protein n=1 Tax=Mesocestoides corti TaxID=53468 RepID=A0A0R3UKT7_MESCO|nr:unnamed protein product [Mesocestoides corti]
MPSMTTQKLNSGVLGKQTGVRQQRSTSGNNEAGKENKEARWSAHMECGLADGRVHPPIDNSQRHITRPHQSIEPAQVIILVHTDSLQCRGRGGIQRIYDTRSRRARTTQQWKVLSLH